MNADNVMVVYDEEIPVVYLASATEASTEIATEEKYATNHNSDDFRVQAPEENRNAFAAYGEVWEWLQNNYVPVPLFKITFWEVALFGLICVGVGKLGGLIIEWLRDGGGGRD